MIQKTSEKVIFTLKGYDALTRVVKSHGNSAYVQIPIAHLGKDVKIIITSE